MFHHVASSVEVATNLIPLFQPQVHIPNPPLLYEEQLWAGTGERALLSDLPEASTPGPRARQQLPQLHALFVVQSQVQTR